MAPKATAARFLFTPSHVSYLKSKEAEWYIAKEANATEDFICRRRRRIAEAVEQETGEHFSKKQNAVVEEAIEAWYKRNCRGRGKADKVGTKDWSIRDVFREENWEQVEEEKERLKLEANYEGTQDIGYHQNAITNLMDGLSAEELGRLRQTAVHWSNIGPLPDVQLRNAEGAAKRFWSFAQDLYRQGNVRVWGMIMYRTKDGSLSKKVMDFNDRLGGGNRLDEAFADDFVRSGFEPLFERWGRAMFATPSDPEPPIADPKSKKGYNRVELAKNDFGEPILPDPSRPPSNEQSHLRWLQKLYRSFLCDHLDVATGGKIKDVPWSRFHSTLHEWVTPDVWPEEYRGDKLKDPSVMRKEHLLEILAFWYGRQESGEHERAFEISRDEDRKEGGRWIPRESRVSRSRPRVYFADGDGQSQGRRQEGAAKATARETVEGSESGEGDGENSDGSVSGSEIDRKSKGGSRYRSATRNTKGKAKAKGKGRGKGKHKAQDSESEGESDTPIRNLKVPPRVPNPRIPDWTASPLKRASSTVVESGVSPPRKKKVRDDWPTKNREEGKKGKGKGKERGVQSDGDGSDSDGDPPGKEKGRKGNERRKAKGGGEDPDGASNRGDSDSDESDVVATRKRNKGRKDNGKGKEREVPLDRDERESECDPPPRKRKANSYVSKKGNGNEGRNDKGNGKQRDDVSEPDDNNSDPAHTAEPVAGPSRSRSTGKARPATPENSSGESTDAPPNRRGRNEPTIREPLRTRAMAQRENIRTRSKGPPIVERPAIAQRKPKPKPKKKSVSDDEDDPFDMAGRRAGRKKRR